MRRRALLVLSGILAVLLVAEVAVRLVGRDLPATSGWPSVSTEVKAKQLGDISGGPPLLIIGSSVTEAGIDPVLLDPGAAAASYNSSFPFFSPAAAEVWLERFFPSWDGVETLVVGLPSWPPPEIEDDRMAAALAEVPPEGSTPFSALWDLRGIVPNLDEVLLRELTIEAGHWTDQGHQQFYYDISGGTFEGEVEPFGESRMNEAQAEALRRIVQRAEDSGLEVLIVIEPGDFPGEASQQSIDEYRAWLAELAADMGVKLRDANDVEWLASDFADHTHPNRAGTVKFTTWLGDLLEEVR